MLSFVKPWDLCWEKFHTQKIKIHVHPQNADSYTKSYANTYTTILQNKLHHQCYKPLSLKNDGNEVWAMQKDIFHAKAWENKRCQAKEAWAKKETVIK